MFYKDDQNIYRVRPLEAFDWLIHGFGTRWSDTFGQCRNLATLHQIHSGTVVDAEGRTGCLGEGDALVTNTPGMLVAVKTADCIPILIVDERTHSAAAVHAGWRGTVKNIAAQAIAEMEKKFGSGVEDLHAAIGPGIGKCCYEVGPDVAAQFNSYDYSLRNCTHSVHLDLAASNRRQIEACGLTPDRIYVAGLCTKCNGEFHSYRRDKERAGRMLSVVGIR
ncbi:MAG TPA: peptidoglycan editing factor PgeF [Bryobacteraceae bacterium]|nr:peptidoglycan editing factor PgeF [Bryobacteraceae bacterium]